jgi:hypothetical protein
MMFLDGLRVGLVRQRVSLYAWVAIRPPTEFGLTGRKLR